MAIWNTARRLVLGVMVPMACAWCDYLAGEFMVGKFSWLVHGMML